MNRKALLIGDGVVSSGFARMNHAYVEGLQRAGWDVSMLALNYDGDPHPYTSLKIYPAYPGGDAFGVGRVKELAEKIKPDLICLTNDPWNIAAYVVRAGNTPCLGSIAVDGLNCRGDQLNTLRYAVFWTAFGEEQARLGGFVGESCVVPLGVDLDIYKPELRVVARQKLGLPEFLNDAFIIGVVGRNQPRKRLDLTIAYFSEWVKQYKIPDAYLFLHVGPTGDRGYDLLQLSKYYGVANRMIINEPEIGKGVREEALALSYNTFNCMLTTTQGEGWGLTHMEGMACGIPQIVPRWSALGEWAASAAKFVRCSGIACTPNNVNVIGGIADRLETIEALDAFYRNPELRKIFVENGLKLVQEERFRWESVGDAYALACEAALEPKRMFAGSDPE